MCSKAPDILGPLFGLSVFKVQKGTCQGKAMSGVEVLAA